MNLLNMYLYKVPSNPPSKLFNMSRKGVHLVFLIDTKSLLGGNILATFQWSHFSHWGLYKTFSCVGSNLGFLINI